MDRRRPGRAYTRTGDTAATGAARKRSLGAKQAMLLGAALVALAVAGTGCVRVELPAVEIENDTDRIALGEASELVALVEMGAGQLSITGGADGAMDAGYEFSNNEWRPEVDYTVRDGEGRLSVRTPSRPRLNLTGHIRYIWDIAFPDDVPLDLSVNMGAGESTLDLRTLDVRQLEVRLGAGDTTIDLPGDGRSDLTADITAGAGALKVRVPSHIGVRVVGHRDGIGSYEADGFIQDGDALVNSAYEDADTRYDITLRRGVGDVTIELVD